MPLEVPATGTISGFPPTVSLVACVVVTVAVVHLTYCGTPLLSVDGTVVQPLTVTDPVGLSSTFLLCTVSLGAVGTFTVPPWPHITGPVAAFTRTNAIAPPQLTSMVPVTVTFTFAALI